MGIIRGKGKIERYVELGERIFFFFRDLGAYRGEKDFRFLKSFNVHCMLFILYFRLNYNNEIIYF